MGTWDNYQAKMEANGLTRRDHYLKNEKRLIRRKMQHSLSFHHVLVEGVEQDVVITNITGDMASKNIMALPCESLKHGGIVDFADSKWLITELDANDEVYSRGIMRRCNYVLKWIDADGNLIEKWCVVEDGTKYLIGEKTEDIMAVGDARIAITIGKDSDTVKLKRGRRFLVDDMDSKESVLAYQITKPNKLFNLYNGDGVFRFILNEVELTDNDNIELRIADYYNWQPYKKLDNEHVDTDITVEEIVENAKNQPEPSDDTEVWL